MMTSDAEEHHDAEHDAAYMQAICRLPIEELGALVLRSGASGEPWNSIGVAGAGEETQCLLASLGVSSANSSYVRLVPSPNLYFSF